jgi:uncharacterized membrane protein
MKLLNDILTETDGKSYELIALLGTVAFIAVILLQAYVTYNTNTFELLNFTTGISTLLVSIGGALKLKPPTIADDVPPAA